jgi:SOS-response transcriptional repressor LexA
MRSTRTVAAEWLTSIERLKREFNSMRLGMTKRQHDCLTFIRQYISSHGHSPTYREISEGIGTKSSSNINRLLVQLKKRGLVDFLPSRARSVYVRERKL